METRGEEVADPIDQLYERIAQVGEGTYGKVYKARCRQSGELVALKKIRMEAEKEGFPVTAAREIKLLKSMNHPNVIKLKKICASSAESVFLVFEYVDFDLAGLAQHPQGTFSVPQVKCIVRQLLEALGYLHGRGIVHRDIKGSNVLIGRDGFVKLADFGLAKVFWHPDKECNQDEELESNRMMTNRVITLWYRPPEVLLGSTKYGPEVDVWGVGCILLDLLSGKPVFTGQDEITQLDSICRRLGSIPPTMDSLRKLGWFQMVSDTLPSQHELTTSPSSPIPGDYLQEEFGDRLGGEGLDFAHKLLNMDPTRRISANEALLHSWFKSEPLPSPLEFLLPQIEGDWHEFECKQRNRKSNL